MLNAAARTNIRFSTLSYVHSPQAASFIAVREASPAQLDTQFLQSLRSLRAHPPPVRIHATSFLLLAWPVALAELRIQHITANLAEAAQGRSRRRKLDLFPEVVAV